MARIISLTCHSSQTLFSSAKMCPLLPHACSVPATCLLTEKEPVLEHHFPRWGISISISKWGNCWCRKSLNKKASPSNVLMKGHVSWQSNEKANNHYKGTPTQGKSVHSKVPCQSPRSVKTLGGTLCQDASTDSRTETPGFIVRSWKWCQEKPFLWAMTI